MKRLSPQLFNGFFSGQLARFIVILFLVYTGVDIMNPQLCNDEFAPISSVSASDSGKRTEDSVAVVARNLNETSERNEQSTTHSDEDCFCCCTHVLPAPTTHPNGVLDVISREASLVSHSVTSAHLMALYHPPRTV